MGLITAFAEAFQIIGHQLACGMVLGAQLMGTNLSSLAQEWESNPIDWFQQTGVCQSSQPPNFLVFGGGGTPASNEIALEKNVLYFQRTLKALGYNPVNASVFFANGNDGKATIRYIDSQGNQKFKVPKIPHLTGAATYTNLQRWLQQTGQQTSIGRNVFFYFTGHGILNPEDADDNALLLWNRQPLRVKQLAEMLDQLPQETTVVTMMAQCFSGSFANLVYEGGNPKRPLALQTRCGFFATIKTLPSVGCTPLVNEADYRDYSSSFFAGLSGRSRTGETVASADYNQDGQVSYTEAHAFAKVDERTTDLPISTSEAWLQRQATPAVQKKLLAEPIAQTLQTARPEQRYVVNALVKIFGFKPELSFAANFERLNSRQIKTETQQAYLVRLRTELLNVGMEKQLRATGSQQKIAALNRLLKCESSFWKKP